MQQYTNDPGFEDFIRDEEWNLLFDDQEKSRAKKRTCPECGFMYEEEFELIDLGIHYKCPECGAVIEIE